MTSKISVSILNADFGNLHDEIKRVEDAGADWLHLDIMDGHFVPNISFGPAIANTCSKITNLPVDTHLMISNPDQFIPDFANAGSTHISVHVENNSHIHRTLQNISSLGKSAGIVVNPGTPVESVYPVLDMVDFVLLMTVNPGFGGQKFITSSVQKIQKLSDHIKTLRLPVEIEVDGGINAETAQLAMNAGADILVCGSYIMKHPDGAKAAVQSLRC